MSLLYPRTISIRRARAPANDSTGYGAQPYQGVEQGSASADNGEDVVVSGVAASIQIRGMGRVKGLDITASDAPGPVQWHIYVAASALAKGVAKDRDVIVDDEGYRYQVAGAYWNILGHKLVCIRLEA